MRRIYLVIVTFIILIAAPIVGLVDLTENVDKQPIEKNIISKELEKELEIGGEYYRAEVISLDNKRGVFRIHMDGHTFLYIEMYKGYGSNSVIEHVCH